MAPSPCRHPYRSGSHCLLRQPGNLRDAFRRRPRQLPGHARILCLFEGVATGVADGYGRMLDRPAATLLHLGPGLATVWPTCTTPAGPVPRSSISSATTPPITSATTPLWNPTSTPWRTPSRPGCAGRAVPRTSVPMRPKRWRRRARGGAVATLILPADVSWGKGGPRRAALPASPGPPVADWLVAEAAGVLSGDEPAVLLLGDRALRQPPLWPPPASAWPRGPGC